MSKEEDIQRYSAKKQQWELRLRKVNTLLFIVCGAYLLQVLLASFIEAIAYWVKLVLPVELVLIACLYIGWIVTSTARNYYTEQHDEASDNQWSVMKSTWRISKALLLLFSAAAMVYYVFYQLFLLNN